MTPVQWYVGFHPPRKTSMWARLGHVEVWGYTCENTWFFMDPQRDRLHLYVTHLHDEVEDLLAHRYANCSEIWRTTNRGELSHPTAAPFFCIPYTAHALGIRAFTFRGLRRQLLRIGAECIYENPEGKPGRRGSA